MGDMTMAIEVMTTTPMKNLMRKTDKEFGDIFSVLPYVNGREKGFCVSDNRGWENRDSLAVAFSECRGSDSLVVYVGRYALYNSEHMEKNALNFINKNNAVMITDDIYYKHAYYVLCNSPKWFKQVGKLIADFLNLKINENQLAKGLKDIDTMAKKELY